MVKWIRRAFALLLVALEFVAFFGWPFPVPSDLNSIADFAVSLDAWLINHASYPGIFVVGLIWAVLLGFPELSAAIMWLRRKTEAPRLTITGPYMHPHGLERHYRMIVANAGGEIAANVKVLLKGIEPKPRYAPWRADYPYPMNRVTAASGHEQSPCNIGPGRSETYEVIAGWESSTGPVFCGSLDTKVDYRNPVQLENDERWTLSYDVAADNAASAEFALDAYVEDKALVVELKSQTQTARKLRHHLDPRRLRR